MFLTGVHYSLPTERRILSGEVSRFLWGGQVMLTLVLIIWIINKHKPYPCMSNALKNKKGTLIR